MHDLSPCLQFFFSQDALVQQVAKSNKNTIVVVNSVGPINMEAWVNHPNVTAIVSLTLASPRRI